MSIFQIDPYVRFFNIYPILTTYNPYSIGYDCRIFVVMKGSMSVFFENCKHSLTKNTLIFIPAGTKYRIEINDSHHFRAMSTNFDFSKKYSALFKEKLDPVSSFNVKGKVLSDTIPPEFSQIIFFECGSLMNYFFQMHHESLSKNQYTSEKLSSLLKYILLSISSEISTSDTNFPTQTLNNITAYILNNYSDCELSNEAIANSFGYHPYYINSLFKSFFGITMHQYILNLRIQSAKTILSALPAASINDVATMSGFNSSSYFSQVFKKYTGLSPFEYRKKHHKNL